MPVPIRARLTMVSAALMAGVLAAVGAFLYLRMRADLLETVDAGLRSRADALLPTVGRPDGGLSDGPGLIEPDEAFAQVLGADGELDGTSPGLGDRPLVAPDDLTDLSGPRFLETVVQTEEEATPARILAVRAPGGRVLQVGASLEDQPEALARLAILMAVGGPLALVLTTGVGWLVAGAALRPVDRLRVEAAAISASEPGRRLPPTGTGDEIARLGETLNDMLDRLERALLRERRFVDEASHEIRTPLANLRAELDLALRRARSPDELEAALRSAAQEADRLARLAEDLLVLARADGGRVPVRREEVDLAPFLAEVVAGFAARASEGGVSIESLVSEGLRANLDPLRIRQAVGNLLDNALRHTASGGTVTLEASRVDSALSIEVRDTGEGFPTAFLPSAFEAFARPGTARARSDGGAGLGLAIVRAVAHGHGGSAEARNHPGGGASVTVRIPE